MHCKSVCVVSLLNITVMKDWVRYITLFCIAKSHIDIIPRPGHNPLETERPPRRNLSRKSPRSSEVQWRASTLTADQFSLWSAELGEIKESEMYQRPSPVCCFEGFFLNSISFRLLASSGFLRVSASTRDWPPSQIQHTDHCFCQTVNFFLKVPV